MDKIWKKWNGLNKKGKAIAAEREDVNRMLARTLAKKFRGKKYFSADLNCSLGRNFKF